MGLTIIVASFGSAAYWGLAIRRGLVIRVYRNQAVGISAISLYFVLFVFQATFFPVDLATEPFVILANAVFDLCMIAIIMLWVNTTVSVARRSDPFESDSLHYSVTKYVWVAAVAIRPSCCWSTSPSLRS